ncbi:unnamed protein product [Dovyalis caffra]|uniref:Wall-associated receptor kinase galacturonan-binding domain-containing protein n=1 Tax=Dovyalis caffra TaxID=77055 RepID=A0AAV1S6E6_9ROSI|nr:unnamed protein product [Dovyalis caffra]
MAAMESVVFQATLLFWSLLIAEAQIMTLPACQPYCGGIEIPYPFGMKAGCYLEESFKLRCNSTSAAPILTVNGIDLQVRRIWVDDSTIEVDFPIVFANCGGKERNTVVDLEGSPFSFSRWNYFIARGCDNLALMNQNQSTIGGCISICDKNSESAMTTCTGINCCQTKIPSYLKVFNVTLKGVDDGKGKREDTECRYAYLVYQIWINERAYGIGYYGQNEAPYYMRDRDYVPVELDWGIDKRVFESRVESRSFDNSSYTSHCEILNPSINSTNQSSTVQCSCTAGFGGNPYLDGVCREGASLSSYRRNIKAKMAGLGMLLHFHSIPVRILVAMTKT